MHVQNFLEFRHTTVNISLLFGVLLLVGLLGFFPIEVTNTPVQE